jgi:hypothetical protein
MYRTVLGSFLVAVATTAASANTTNCKITLAQYQSLTSGMSYSKAVTVLGCEGSELSRSEKDGFKTVTYSWEGTGLANMTAMFRNDALVAKAQFGLK